MSERKKVAFYTLGCKLNFSETSTIARNFNDEGFERVDFEEIAELERKDSLNDNILLESKYEGERKFSPLFFIKSLSI